MNPFNVELHLRPRLELKHSIHILFHHFCKHYFELLLILVKISCVKTNVMWLHSWIHNDKTRKTIFLRKCGIPSDLGLLHNVIIHKLCCNLDRVCFIIFLFSNSKRHQWKKSIKRVFSFVKFVWNNFQIK